MKENNLYTTWKPEPGYLVLLPSRLSNVAAGGIILPESHTKKNNSGICVKAGTDIDRELLMGRECFFPNHSEYQILDSDTGYHIYLVKSSEVIMTRIPPQEVDAISREKGGDDLTLHTIHHPTPAA